MPSFTTSLKDTLSELTSSSSKSKTEDKNTTTSTPKPTDNDQRQDKNWSQASRTAARAYDDYRQGHTSEAQEELEQAASAAASAYKAGGGKFDAKDFAGGLVSDLIPGSKAGSGNGSGNGSGSGGEGLLPVNLKGEDPEGEGGEEKAKSGGGAADGGHEEGVTSVNDPAKEKSGCACFTGTDARTGTKPSTCCATTGSCADCKGCKDSQDKGAYCQCQCQNQKSKNTGGEGCACQRQDGSDTQQQDNGQKSSSFKDISTASGLGAGAGAGTGEDHGLNNPLTTDAINTGQSTVHGFGGRASGLDTGSGDFNPSPSAITAATDELIAGAKGESESAGRGTGAYTGSALGGGEFGGQD